jgi:hypothetical protein
MVAVVRSEDRAPDPDPDLVALLQAPPRANAREPSEKKALS